MGYFTQITTPIYRVYITSKKDNSPPEYTTLTPTEIKSWSKNYTIEKVSKLIPIGKYTKTQFESYLINGGLSKADLEKQKKENQFLTQYNKNNNTNFKTIEALLIDKRRKSQEHKRKERERSLLKQKKRAEHKANQEAILRFSAIKLGIEKGIYTQEILDKPDARKLISQAHQAQKTVITNLVDDIHKTPLLLRKQFKTQINSIKSQLHKEIDKL